MTIQKPEPDGFLTIYIEGHVVKVNAYRDSTMEAYAQAWVNEALERAAKLCDDCANKNEEAVSDDEPDEASSLRAAAWQISLCANRIRALKVMSFKT